MILKQDMPLDIVEQYPQTDPVFRTYDEQIGQCLLCHCLFDSLETIARRYDIDLAEMIQQLERAAGENGGSNDSIFSG